MSICRSVGGYKSGRRKNRNTVGDGSKVKFLSAVFLDLGHNSFKFIGLWIFIEWIIYLFEPSDFGRGTQWSWNKVRAYLLYHMCSFFCYEIIELSHLQSCWIQFVKEFSCLSALWHPVTFTVSFENEISVVVGSTCQKMDLMLSLFPLFLNLKRNVSRHFQVLW